MKIEYKPTLEVTVKITGLTYDEKENIQEFLDNDCCQYYKDGILTKTLIRELKNFSKDFEKGDKPGVEYLFEISKKVKADGFQTIDFQLHSMKDS